MGLFRLEQTMTLDSPNKINKTEVNGKIYATDENGKGLYLLVPSNIARFDGEGALKGLRKYLRETNERLNNGDNVWIGESHVTTVAENN